MATTMKLIAKNVLGSSASSVTFSDIPGTYTDLLLITSTRSNATNQAFNAQLTFNGSSTGYSERLLYGNGVSALSATNSGSSIIWSTLSNGGSSTSNTFSNGSIYIPNYAGSANKSISAESVNENNSATANFANIYIVAGLWSNTAAITSVTLTSPSGGGDFISGSSFFLYGITKA